MAIDVAATSAEVITSTTGPDSESEQASDAEIKNAEQAVNPVRTARPARGAVVFGILAVAALAGLTAWLGYAAYQSHQAQQRRAQFISVARQEALNLTTIDHQHAEADVRRIVDGATGQFYDEFSSRAGPFVDVVRKAQSTSVGTVTEAGVESASGSEAQVIVAVTVKTAAAGAPDQTLHSWRMRLTVHKMGDDMKVSQVGFVP